MEEYTILSNLKRPKSNFSRYVHSHRLATVICFTLIFLFISVTTYERPLSARDERWLELRNLSGIVEVLRNGWWSQAQRGQRLSSVGNSIRTGYGSLARLAVDTGVGFVGVSQDTELRISELYTTSRGGKVTELEVKYGQARVFVRPFTNPDSRLEIRTPSGVMGVRGTNFGMDIQPNGRTALATLEGAVTSSAQGESVSVLGGFQNHTFPGEPPSVPTPLSNDTSLNISKLARDRGIIEVKGQISPYNLLFIERISQDTDREGNFDLQFPLPEDNTLQAEVITPLGTEQIYELVAP
jgi:hypothetical protein